MHGAITSKRTFAEQILAPDDAIIDVIRHPLGGFAAVTAAGLEWQDTIASRGDLYAIAIEAHTLVIGGCRGSPRHSLLNVTIPSGQ